MELTVLFGDPHVPYYHRGAWRALLACLKEIKPQRVVIVGDFLDLAALSRFIPDPRRLINIQDEINEGRKLLDELRQAVGNKCEIVMLEGNHDFRPQKFLIRNAPQLLYLTDDGEYLLSVPHLLELKKRKITWIPYDQFYVLHGFNIEHGFAASKHAGYTAKNTVNTRIESSIIGHTHRFGSSCVTGLFRSLQGYEIGCLMDRNSDGAAYAKFPNWQMGWAVGEYDKKEDLFQVTPILIQNGKFIYQGKVWK